MNSEQSIGSAAAACLAGRRVLVVEDTWVVAKMLQSLLEETGLVVSGPTSTVADAQRLISENVPELAVVDIKLKDDMAFGLIDCLHERGVPVVVLTGYSSPPAKVAAFVHKPFSGVELIATLHHLVTHASEARVPSE